MKFLTLSLGQVKVTCMQPACSVAGMCWQVQSCQDFTEVGPPAAPLPLQLRGLPSNAWGGCRLSEPFPPQPLRHCHPAMAGGAGWVLLCEFLGLIFF